MKIACAIPMFASSFCMLTVIIAGCGGSGSTTGGGGGGGGGGGNNPTATTNLVIINTPVNEMVWDSTYGKIYATLPSTDTNGNSIVAIDPAKGIMGTPQPAGSEPDHLALSSNDSFLYVSLDGTGQIKRFTLPDLTLDSSLNITLPYSNFFGQQVALALAVAPGQPHTFVTVAGDYAVSSPDTAGTFIYDDSTPRTNSIAPTANTSGFAWGSDTILYSNNAYSSGSDLYIISVNASGLTLTSDYGYMVPTNYAKIHFDQASGYIYTDAGRVVDPGTASVVGTFNTSLLYGFPTTQCALDSQHGVVFFLGQTYAQYHAGAGATIEAFDMNTYKLLNILTVPESTGTPFGLVRWGNAGLAFHTSANGFVYLPQSGPVYLVDGSFVNSSSSPDFTTGTALVTLPTLASISPQSAAAGAANTTLTVTGTNFTSDAYVMWNGTSLQTTVSSKTQLQATIPSTDLATSGSAIISVSDTTAGISTPTSLTFTILPSSSGTTSLSAWNYASMDLAWDATDSRLILPVWSADPVYPNSILEIDPTDGSITKSTTSTTDPELVRITDDDKNIYVGFGQANEVQELTLPNLGTSTSWSLGNNKFNGPYYAWDIEPAPGAPQTTAVNFANYCCTPPQNEGMTIYDSGVARPNIAASGRFQNLQWNQGANTIYGGTVDYDLYALSVDSTGIISPPLLYLQGTSAFPGNIHYDSGTGNLFTDSGLVYNSATFAVVGNFNASGLSVLDASLGKVFILGQLSTQVGTNNYTIQSFNQTTFAPVSSITLNSLIGTPAAFVRWGTNGLALVTFNLNASNTKGPAGMLYIISDNVFVSAKPAPEENQQNTERVHSFPRPNVHRAVSDYLHPQAASSENQ